MGEVYAGFDETLKRRVALKAIRAEQRLDPEAKARFLREARILSPTRSRKHLPPLRLHSENTDQDWLVLELIEGRSSRTALTAELSSAMRMRIAKQESAGVLVATHAGAHCHSSQSSEPRKRHADRDGWEFKVLDFGLAQSAYGNLTTGFFRCLAQPCHAGCRRVRRGVQS